MQAIVTTYIGPTDTKGSRVKAQCDADSVTLHWDDALNAEGNHDWAAVTLRNKLGWNAKTHGKMCRGCPPNSKGYVYVFVKETEMLP